MSFKKILYTIIAVVIIVLGFFYFKNNKVNVNMPQQPMDQTTQPSTNNSGDSAPVAQDSYLATIDTSLGSFEVTLDHKAAPKTVENFVKLANQGFYNNLTFHRIVAGFMIQGGDPKGDGTGGPGYTIPAEIGLKHTKGAIAMARLSDAVNPEKASSGSQFYVTLDATPFLDGQYTVFGYVTSGMDVVEKIGAVPVQVGPGGEKSSPITPVIINKITIK
ncbi:MAG TPA: peptidylprolyl isomerase [Methylomirabilota bacterium]|nr:peptidylprolyl isomerase [Methylomirabilota bacterium]